VYKCTKNTGKMQAVKKWSSGWDKSNFPHHKQPWGSSHK